MGSARRAFARLIVAALAASTAPAASAAGWTAPFGPTGSSAATDGKRRLQVLASAAQHTYALWLEPAPGSQLMVAQRPPGGGFGVPLPVASGSVDSFDAVVMADGGLEIVWHATGATSLSFGRLAPGGAAVTDPGYATRSVPTGAGDAQLAHDASGQAFLAYTSETQQIVFAHRAAGGGDFATDASVTTATGTNRVTDLAVAPSGAFAAACWVRRTQQTTAVYTAECARLSGVSATAPQQLDTLTESPGVATLLALDARVAFAPSGDLLAASALDLQGANNATSGRVRHATMPTAASSFTTPQQQPTASSVGSVDVAADSAGTGLVSWAAFGSTSTSGTIRAAAVELGSGAASALGDLDSGAAHIGNLRLDRLTDGSVLAAWDNTGTVKVADRPAGASFGPVSSLRSDPANRFGSLDLAPLAAGEAAVGWALGAANAGAPLQLAVLDRTAPLLTANSLPSSGLVGEALSFTADATDAWSPFSLGWSFGDGATAAGPSVTHAYAAPGSFTASVTPTDATGNAGGAATRAVAISAASAPPPPPPAPVPPPAAGKSGNILPVSGTIRVKLPGTTRFVRIETLTSIPVGTIVDARRGTVRLTVSDGRGGTYTGLFSGGIFRFTQARRPLPRLSPRARTAAATAAAPKRKPVLITDLKLVAGNFKRCPRPRRAARRASLPAQAAKRRVVRYLQARARGRFNVIGRRASGIERGTAWRTTDTCDATEVRVTQGAVVVTDRVRRRTVLVRKGRTYIARAPAARQR